jgi:hypothetical protein
VLVNPVTSSRSPEALTYSFVFIHPLHPITADDPVRFRNSVGGLTLLAQKYTFSCLPSARIIPRPYTALHKGYDSIFGPPPQQSERFEADAVYSRGFLHRLSE